MNLYDNLFKDIHVCADINMCTKCIDVHVLY